MHPCSASYKDALSRTIEKGTRGKVSGSAGTMAAIAVLAFAILLSTGLLPREPLTAILSASRLSEVQRETS